MRELFLIPPPLAGEGLSSRRASSPVFFTAPGRPSLIDRRAAPKKSRGRAGRQGPDGPADLDTSQHRGVLKSVLPAFALASFGGQAASPPNPRRPARGVWRFAPPRPRWTSRFRRPASPLELAGRLSTAVGPGRVRRACDRCRSRHHGARRRAVGAPGRGGLDRRRVYGAASPTPPTRPPLPAPRLETLIRHPSVTRDGMRGL
jgi:hypothetical protein